jgi:ribosomal protein S18 acetylase RimI-like enzyme
VGRLLNARPYQGAADLRLMQDLVAAVWADRREKSPHHVGDLAWWAHQHVGRDSEWNRRLWLEGSQCVAWAWLDRPAELTFAVHPDVPAHDPLLDWFEREAEGDAPLSVWTQNDDADACEVLERRGYRHLPGARSYLHYACDLAASLADPVVPHGYTLRTVRGQQDVRERVEVHRAVWHPSRVTEESFRNVMASWPYRAELDCVAETREGRFAAYVLCWYDGDNRAGEFEPVGTHPDHRRRGLGAAICTFALRRLQDHGARTAVVYAGGREEDAPARALYESLGFRPHAREVEWRRSR